MSYVKMSHDNTEKMDTNSNDAVTVSITQIDVTAGVLPEAPTLSSSVIVSPITSLASTSVDIISIPSSNSVEVTNSISNNLSSSCLVCNSLSIKGAELPDNHIFSPFCRTTYSSKTIAETLDKVLELVLLPNTQHSELVCLKCFKLLDLIDSLELQLRLKRNEVKALYYNTQGLAYFRINQRLEEQEPVKVKPDSLEQQQTILASSENLESEESDDSKAPKPDLKLKPSEWLLSKKANKKPKPSLVVKVPPENVIVEPPRKSEKGLLTSDDLTCQLCHKPFEKRRYLMDHLRRTHKTPIYSCKGCDEKFASRSLLLRHIHKCTQFKQKQIVQDTEKEEASKVLTKRKKNNKCTMCSKWFLTKALLSEHREKEHFNKAKTSERASDEENETETLITCQLCNIVVNNDVALAIHASSVHGCERPWVCHICNKTFARRPELANHERIHTGEKPFQCDMCGATFNQKTNLHTHVRHSHLGEKRYPCMYCDQKFKRKRLLDCHVNAKHTYEKPYTCRVCPAAFAYPEHARKHELTHCKAKNFSCAECNKEFRSKLSLQRHVHQGCNRTKFFCGTCESNFTKKSALLDHLNKSGHPQGIIKQEESDAGQSFMVDGGASVALSIDEVEEVSQYDEGVVLYLSDRSVMDTSLYYHSAGVEGTGVEVSAEEEVQTAILSIAPDDGGGGGKEGKEQKLIKSGAEIVHFVEGQIVHSSTPGSFVEIATENL